MRKFLIAMVAALVGVGAYAMLAGADEGPGGTSWTFELDPAKAGKSTTTDSLIQPAVRDDKGTADPDDDTYKETKKTTIFFPKGSSFNTAVPPRCSSGGELASSRGAACKKAKVGSGAAISLIGTPPDRRSVATTIEAYNKKNGIFFLLQPCTPGTGPGQANTTCTPLGNPFVLEGKLKFADRKKTQPILIVPTPANLLAQHVIITSFALKTENITKTRKVNGKKVVLPYTTTPSKCLGKWKSKAKMQYTDGSKLEIGDTFRCRK